jgi:CRISPR-associated protein Csm3
LLVRDCHLKEDSAEQLREIDTGLYMTEWKFENGIDRVTAAANPRQFERVPAGAEFKFEMVYTVEDESQVEEDVQNLAIALKILEDDALGGHGSRGYGKIRFKDFTFEYRDIEHYRQMTSSEVEKTESSDTIATTDDLLNRFGEVKKLLPQSEK